MKMAGILEDLRKINAELEADDDDIGILQDLRKINAELEGEKVVARETRFKRTSYGSVVEERSKKPRGPGPRPSPHHECESSLDTTLIQDEVDNFVVYAETKLVSFTTIPVYIDGGPAWGATPPEKVFVEGNVGPNGAVLTERIKMWRLMLHPMHRPQFLLKTEKGAWVRLLNPRKDYTKIMNDVHVLGHFLNFVKKNPNASTTAAEKDLQKMCRTHSSKPTLDKLSRHIEVIRCFIEQDDEFAEAPVLKTIFPNLFPENSSPERDESDDSEYEPDPAAGVKRKSGRQPLQSESAKKKKKVTTNKYVQKLKPLKVPTLKLHRNSDYPRDHRTNHKLKIGRNLQDVKCKPSESLQRGNDGSVTEGDGSVTEDEVSETEDDFISEDAHSSIFTQAEKDAEDPPICVLCDEGGDLLYCDGPCHRHFHHTKASGVDSCCATLGLSAAEVKAMGKYYCPNCKHKEQQCFSCGELGSSVATAYDSPQVRCCEIAFCHKFFHSECAASALMCESSTDRDWRDLSDAIRDGRKQLFCPRHCCSVCGQAEIKEPGLLIQCRRCPKAWHRECLLNFSQSKELQSTKIWKHADRGFIYCRDHEIIPELETPARTHLRFPDA